MKKYPSLDGLIKNPASKYKWTISGFDELSEFIKSIRSEKKRIKDYFIRPKVLVLFPEDIFESERVFIRLLMEKFAREIYLIESFYACQLSIFSIQNLDDKKILSLGDRLNQSYTYINNAKNIDYKIINDSNEEIQDLNYDLIISHKSEDNSTFKGEVFLHGETLRNHLILGSKKYIEFLNSTSIK
ncbi:hypothetical protein CH372_19320 [Leptospira meyeri]|nr:hypothetical protein CH372_19320 [Leptospira meyeri]PKA23530.1 hypothetical protein CH381_25270 [Leptospira sp. mixed culture ATI2-C-A1]